MECICGNNRFCPFECTKCGSISHYSRGNELCDINTINDGNETIIN